MIDGKQVIEPGVRIVETDTGFDPATGWQLGPTEDPDMAKMIGTRRYLVVQYEWPRPGVTLGWDNTYIDRRVFDITDAPGSIVGYALSKLAHEFPTPVDDTRAGGERKRHLMCRMSRDGAGDILSMSCSCGWDNYAHPHPLGITAAFALCEHIAQEMGDEVCAALDVARKAVVGG